MGFKVIIQTQFNDFEVNVTDAETPEAATQAACRRVLAHEGRLWDWFCSDLGWQVPDDVAVVEVSPLT